MSSRRVAVRADAASRRRRVPCSDDGTVAGVTGARSTVRPSAAAGDARPGPSARVVAAAKAGGARRAGEQLRGPRGRPTRCARRCRRTSRCARTSSRSPSRRSAGAIRRGTRSLLRQAMVGAAQRLVEYVEAAAHGGGADADAARRIGLSPAAAARARSRRPRRSAALLVLGAICVTAGIASTAPARALWARPPTLLSPVAPQRRERRRRRRGRRRRRPRRRRRQRRARGAFLPHSRVVGLLRCLRVDPSAAARGGTASRLLHPLGGRCVALLPVIDSTYCMNLRPPLR